MRSLKGREATGSGAHRSFSPCRLRGSPAPGPDAEADADVDGDGEAEREGDEECEREEEPDELQPSSDDGDDIFSSSSELIESLRGTSSRHKIDFFPSLKNSTTRD